REISYVGRHHRSGAVHLLGGATPASDGRPRIAPDEEPSWEKCQKRRAGQIREHSLKRGCMYFLSWIIVGLIMGWVTRKLLKAGGYGPIVDFVVCIAGAVAGGFVVLVASFPSHGGLVYSTLAAILGAVILREFTGYATDRKRYA